MSNPLRGEAAIHVEGREILLRPSFDALVRAEEELGALLALVERAGEGRLKLQEIAALFWHCAVPADCVSRQADCVSRQAIGQAVLAMGLARAARPLRILLGEILKGSE